jgi:hydroxyethylthiazole kinase
MPDAIAVWTVVEAVRQRRPLVHNITNLVVMNPSANALLAIGASPAMVHAPEEVEEFVALVDALVVNVGTISANVAVAMRLAVATANRLGKPWVLDPVAAGISVFRKTLCADLAASRPRVIRGNASEILTLAGEAGAHGRGVDSADPVEAAADAAARLARSTGAVVAVTGAVDVVTDGTTTRRIANGHPMLTLVTGMGCSLTAVTGAFVAAEPDPVLAATAALSFYGLAGELAAERSAGPGSFQPAMFDALYTLDRATFLDRVRVS